MGVYTELEVDIIVNYDENVEPIINLVDDLNSPNDTNLSFTEEEAKFESKYREFYPLFLNNVDSRQSIIYCKIEYVVIDDKVRIRILDCELKIIILL